MIRKNVIAVFFYINFNYITVLNQIFASIIMTDSMKGNRNVWRRNIGIKFSEIVVQIQPKLIHIFSSKWYTFNHSIVINSNEYFSTQCIQKSTDIIKKLVYLNKPPMLELNIYRFIHINLMSKYKIFLFKKIRFANKIV